MTETRNPFCSSLHRFMLARRLAGASLLALCLALSVAGSGSVAQTASNSDLSALRYYLQQQDANAVQAELRRLRSAFPDWRPPSDLSELLAPSRGSTIDEAAIWRRIEARDYSAARRLIEDGRARQTDWTPPAEMLRVLETNEAQLAFETAVANRNPTEAISVARRAPQIMTCERINNAWQLADMYVLANQNNAALATYRSTLQSCPNYAQQEVTLQKASAVGSSGELAQLFDTARQANPGARGQLDQLAGTLGAGRAVAQAAPQPSRQSAPQSSPQPAAPPAGNASAPAAASRSFANLPLRGDPRAGAVRRLKEQESYARCLAESQNPRSLEVLYERSWCAFSHQRPTEAILGFQAAAAAGGGLAGTVRRDAHYGLALSYLSLNMTEQGAQVAEAVQLSPEQHQGIEAIVLDQRGVKAYRMGDFRRAIGYLDALEQLQGSLRRDLSILRAYAYLNSNQRPRARAEFERLHSQLATAETRAGLNAALGP